MSKEFTVACNATFEVTLFAETLKQAIQKVSDNPEKYFKDSHYIENTFQVDEEFTHDYYNGDDE